MKEGRNRPLCEACEQRIPLLGAVHAIVSFDDVALCVYREFGGLFLDIEESRDFGIAGNGVEDESFVCSKLFECCCIIGWVDADREEVDFVFVLGVGFVDPFPVLRAFRAPGCHEVEYGWLALCYGVGELERVSVCCSCFEVGSLLVCRFCYLSRWKARATY